jgi:hypothetical protein
VSSQGSLVLALGQTGVLVAGAGSGEKLAQLISAPADADAEVGEILPAILAAETFGPNSVAWLTSWVAAGRCPDAAVSRGSRFGISSTCPSDPGRERLAPTLSASGNLMPTDRGCQMLAEILTPWASPTRPSQEERAEIAVSLFGEVRVRDDKIVGARLARDEHLPLIASATARSPVSVARPEGLEACQQLR